MTQYSHGIIDPDTTNGQQLASLLSLAEAAQLTLHTGSVRPPYATAGTLWLMLDGVNRSLMLFDGTNDILLFRFDADGNRAADAALLGGIKPHEVLRSDQSGTVSGRVTISEDNEEQLQLGKDVEHNPMLGFYRGENRIGNLQVFSDRVTITLEGDTRSLELRRDGTLMLNGNKVWHEGNHGPNSGLNSDLLDDREGDWYQDLANATGTIATANLPMATPAQAIAGLLSSFLMTPATTAEAIKAHGFAEDAEWHDVTFSRAVSTDIQNLTGRPILVSVGGWMSNPAEPFLVGPSLSAMVPVGSAGDWARWRSNILALVPPNHYYRANGGSFHYWAEYY